MIYYKNLIANADYLQKLIRGSYTLKPRPYFCRTLPPVYKIDKFLAKEFMSHKIDDYFMLLVLAEFYKKWCVF